MLRDIADGGRVGKEEDMMGTNKGGESIGMEDPGPDMFKMGEGAVDGDELIMLGGMLINLLTEMVEIGAGKGENLGEGKSKIGATFGGGRIFIFDGGGDDNNFLRTKKEIIIKIEGIVNIGMRIRIMMIAKGEIKAGGLATIKENKDLRVG